LQGFGRCVFKGGLITLILFGVLYPGFVWLVAFAAPENATGLPITTNGHIIGFENIGQPFDTDRYFNSRPSAVGYNAAATGGSNQGPTNPAHLQAVKDRLDTLLVHNPGVAAGQVPSELVTASGGGLDPHISPVGALLQVPRIARARSIPEADLRTLVEKHTEQPWLGVWGMPRVNVLKINLALDNLR
jgi:K+-transporting ATPase ATPase C chain